MLIKEENVLRYVSTKSAFIRHIFRTTNENHIHIVAASDSIRNLKYLIRMIQKDCGDDIAEIQSHAVKSITHRDLGSG